jgi:hypothetical protein
MKTLAGPQSGAQGNIVASRNRSGQFLRQRVSLKSNFSFIGLLPAPDECISLITRLYLNKLKDLKKLARYRRTALAGSRVFVRAVQQVNGWEDKLHMFAGSAVIPAS